uniref:Uncharacterized protein n=1 Tax=Heterorhabditis bacteriophora TaxID=37862 RepID=A0A1I7XS86_HETBA
MAKVVCNEVLTALDCTVISFICPFFQLLRFINYNYINVFEDPAVRKEKLLTSTQKSQ